MSLHLVLTADTHLPDARRLPASGVSTRRLPDELWAAIDAADVVVHAGDWMAPGLLDDLEARARRLVACWGNNDGDDLRARLPETAVTELDGVRLAVTHETGAADRSGASVRRPLRARLRHAGRRPGLRAQPHPVGQRDPRRCAAPQPRLAHRAAPRAGVHLHDGGDRGGPADGGAAARAGVRSAPPGTPSWLLTVTYYGRVCRATPAAEFDHSG